MTLIKDIIYGKAIGDALGLPHEFTGREFLKEKPITEMTGYGCYKQPKGTWSDDTSLALAIADSIGSCNGYSLDDIAKKMLDWMLEGKYTPDGFMFDIGMTTRKALNRLKDGLPPTESGFEGEEYSSNGSIMRTLALVPYLINKSIEERYRIVSEVSAITHASFTAKFACFFVTEYAIMLLGLKDKLMYARAFTTLILVQENIKKFIEDNKIEHVELNNFNIILDEFENISIDTISSGGYCIDTLESSIWCLMESKNYKDAVLKAVNLGGDTDSTAAVTGALAGILYGFDSMPSEWVEALQNKKLIDSIIEKYESCKF